MGSGGGLANLFLVGFDAAIWDPLRPRARAKQNEPKVWRSTLSAFHAPLASLKAAVGPSPASCARCGEAQFLHLWPWA